MFLPIGLFTITGHAVRALLVTPLTGAIIGMAVAGVLVVLLFSLLWTGSERD
jgi:putative effector of murein hydrolase LrgA (UPF0299 family)